MKRMITTAGLAALGAASLAPSFAQDVMLNQKPYAFGLALRGFYDDNYNTYPRELRDRPGYKDDTFGFDVSPSVAYNVKRGPTTFGASYLYTFRYFIDRPRPRDDQSHQGNIKLSHAFSDRFSMDVADSLVIAQEPAVIDPDISRTLPSRVQGSNLRNFGAINFSGQFAESHVGANVGYSNTIFDYEEDASDMRAIERRSGFPITGVGSRSSVLDRMVHTITAEGNYQVLPKTIAALEYRYRFDDYTSQDIFYRSGLYGDLPGDVKDNQSHYVSVGVRQNINRSLDVSAKIGMQMTTYDRTDLFDDKVSPWGEASARYTYAQGSSVQVNARHERIPTDLRVGLVGVGSPPIADQEATTISVALNHAITAKMSVIAMAGYQYSILGQSTRAVGDQEIVDHLFFAGATLAYQFNRHVAAEIAYTFDRLDSDFGIRSFTRNRIFIGTRLSL